MTKELFKAQDIYNKNILFTGKNNKKIEAYIKKYIKGLSKDGNYIFLLDSFWSKERYHRFKGSRYLKEIERRYHIKLSVDDFMQKENIFDYMDNKEINILKVKSIIGYMSAAELFPVIISKINNDIKGNNAYILINDFVLEELDDDAFLDLYTSINNQNINFFVYNKNKSLPKNLTMIIDDIIKAE
ncbi:hypothetical protein [Dethiothermospora halolimnae]|uniref:hypothetical protein n=1 Tax=Dethiothermospora halolimnae TaxID=3114390 RepID=UPI003CCBB1BD